MAKSLSEQFETITCKTKVLEYENFLTYFQDQPKESLILSYMHSTRFRLGILYFDDENVRSIYSN